MKHVQISISASYYTLGDLTSETKYVWLVCHGQGQLAEYFIKKFMSLDDTENFIIAPQGLSKYYLNGFTGRVGASWMTKEDRETEIQNQQSLISAVWEKEVGGSFGGEIILFGFSQGAATISRFAAFSKLPFSKMVLWAGGFAHDLNRSQFAHLSGDESIQCYYSHEDQFFEESMVDKQNAMIKITTGLDANSHFYEGGHTVVPGLLPDIVSI